MKKIKIFKKSITDKNITVAMFYILNLLYYYSNNNMVNLDNFINQSNSAIKKHIHKIISKLIEQKLIQIKDNVISFEEVFLNDDYILIDEKVVKFCVEKHLIYSFRAYCYITMQNNKNIYNFKKSSIYEELKIGTENIKRVFGVLEEYKYIEMLFEGKNLLIISKDSLNKINSEYYNKIKILNKTSCYKNGMLTHKDSYESIIENYLKDNLDLIESGMSLIGNQIEIVDGVIDILARDKDNILCIIELKTFSDCKDLIWQCAYYPTQFNEIVRVITVAPEYHNKIYLALKRLPKIEMFKYNFDDNLTMTISKYD